MGFSSLNLIQVKGGRIIKQSDSSTPFSFVLIDSVGNEIPLNGKKALVSLRNPLARTYWETTVTVRDSTVEFKMPGNLLDDKYILEISCDGYVFPSDNDYIINVKKGYAELLDGKTATLYKQTAKELVREEAEKAVRELGKTELKGEKGETGKTGATGKSITITNTTKQGKDNIITFSDKTQITVKDGADGVDGKDAKVDAASIAKLSQADKDTIRKDINAPSKDEVVLKEVGKGLSDNNFDNQYKKKLDDLDQTFKDVNDSLDKVKSKQDNHLSDLTSLGAYEVGDKIIKLKPTITGDEVKIGYVEIGKILENDFVVFPFTGEILNIKFKSEAEGHVLLYGKPDYDDPEHPELKYVANETEKATKIAVKVDKNINSYLIDFTEVGPGLPGQKFEGNLVITNVTMPEDKVSVIREEGL